MQINLSPIRRDMSLQLTRSGDALTINGEVFDFSPLSEGATLPAEAIASDWFAGPVERVGGELHLTLALPHGTDAPRQTLFPTSLSLTGDGPVSLPPYERETEHDD
ncbi:hypothetical protein RA2_04198 [Roseovarius sp. A-2]|uniref:hypothetical protein n=1 Tax=Roseovarius sp. A-2 TaxID=1570360 RepID=UPI0009B594E7|nr:hypothetical protein [Roseovarius sp. A-2]GAW37123.1 hypothetical protein RA2_04198 [Roseovarius sp. A-2]